MQRNDIVMTAWRTGALVQNTRAEIAGRRRAKRAERRSRTPASQSSLVATDLLVLSNRIEPR